MNPHDDDTARLGPDHGPGATQPMPQHGPQPVSPHVQSGGQPYGFGPGPRESGSWFDESGLPVGDPSAPAPASAAWGSDRDAAARDAERQRQYDVARGVPVDANVPEPTRASEPSSGSTRSGSGGGLSRRLALALAVGCLLLGLVGGLLGNMIGDKLGGGDVNLPESQAGAPDRPKESVAHIAATATQSVVTFKVSSAQGSGTGSGFVIDNNGHILTNNHVVEEAASGGTIRVILANGETHEAKLVGRDVSYDLAVVKMDKTDIKPLVLGKSSDVVVGDGVIAVGAPLGLDQTVTTGIVSALNRPVTPGKGSEASFISAIQTDAAINPGNSGGPLLNMKGEVIGVNSAIARVPGTSDGASGSIGLGFSIPSDVARRAAEQLIKTGKAEHPMIGVYMDRTFTGSGAKVRDGDGVIANGPAAKAGVQAGDVITKINGKRIQTPDELIVGIRALAVGDRVTLTVERNGQTADVQMQLEADKSQ